jgi:hypothetical protein
MVAVGANLMGMDASPQAEHVSRRCTHWLFVSCRALIGLARIRRCYAGLHAHKIPIVDGDGSVRVAMCDTSPTEIDMLDQPSKDAEKSTSSWRFLKLLGYSGAPSAGPGKGET